MDNPDARFCGRCGLPLHTEALESWDAPPDPHVPDSEEPHASPLDEPDLDDAPAPWTTSRSAAAFEFAVPGLDALSQDVEVAAALEGIPDAATEVGVHGEDAAPLPPVPTVWPAALPDPPGTVRLDGCLIHLPGGAALIDLELAVGASLNVSASTLLWTSAVRLDRLLVGGNGAPGHPPCREYLQLHGPGSAALTAGADALAIPWAVTPDMALILAPDVLLAASRRVRLSWQTMEAGPGLRLVARTAEPVLLRCPVGARTLDIPTGEWLTVAGSAVLARDASLGCVALERKDAAGARQGERRLTGPGRVLLGFWPVERYP